MRFASSSLARKAYPERDKWSHKGDFGRVLVVGGSRMYSGAPALAALAALRAGCDLASIAAPERAANIAASFSPDIISFPLPGNYLNKLHLHSILELAEKADSLVIGSGAGRRRETLSLMTGILSRASLPCVIDADALHAIPTEPDVLNSSFLLTPHSGEFSMLSGRKLPRNTEERSLAVESFAKKLGCTVLLKGHVDIISDGKRTILNRTGTPFMTKGGTGDVLAGICGAMLSMGLAPLDAASCAAYINGLAGEIASKSRGPGMLASDMLECIPAAISEAIKQDT